MKAFLLAAGLGTRLKPITDHTPKCLIPICGRPLLDWWYLTFQKHGITDVLINLHYLKDEIKGHIIKNYTHVNFTFFEEEELLGSAGTLKKNKEFVQNDTEFFIIYADNLTNYNLQNMLNFHRSSNYEFTMALFKTDLPQTKGIATLNKFNVVTEFEEKPILPKSKLANAGIYLSTPTILDLIPDKQMCDIGFDMLPKLVNNMRGWVTNDYLIDVGNFEHLKKAELEWSKIIGEKNELQ